jgi:hypothetical protein
MAGFDSDSNGWIDDNNALLGQICSSICLKDSSDGRVQRLDLTV